MPTQIETAANNGSDKVVVEEVATDRPSAAAVAAAPAAAPAPAKTAPPHWAAFVRTANVQEIKDRLAGEIADILRRHGLDTYCCLALIEPQESIDGYDLDQIFRALNELNPDGQKDVILFILSRGGEGEPAYQISKLCKSYARQKFIAVVPRQAKSAATLLAIGADEIHMGPLGQLGPIDPQIGGLPALGVSQALKTIASVSELYPKSAEMFARYLRMALTVEQIGYCDRISESAVQYAERLLSTKPQLAKRAPAIAKELVHEYKDHNFVIDFAEAQLHLGPEWIKTGTPELQAGEEIYSLVEMVNFFLGMAQSKRIFITGGASLTYSIMMPDAKR